MIEGRKILERSEKVRCGIPVYTTEPLESRLSNANENQGAIDGGAHFHKLY